MKLKHFDEMNSSNFESKSFSDRMDSVKEMVQDSIYTNHKLYNYKLSLIDKISASAKMKPLFDSTVNLLNEFYQANSADLNDQNLTQERKQELLAQIERKLIFHLRFSLFNIIFKFVQPNDQFIMNKIDDIVASFHSYYVQKFKSDHSNAEYDRILDSMKTQKKSVLIPIYNFDNLFEENNNQQPKNQ